MCKKLLPLFVFLILCQNLPLEATPDNNSTNSYRFCPLGCNGEFIYYLIESVKQNENSVSLDKLQLDFSKIEVNTNLVSKINPSDIPQNLEFSEIQINILNQFFPQNLSTFSLKWTFKTNIKENTYSLFLCSQIVNKKIAVIDFPLTEYEKALDPSIAIEDFSSYLFPPHNFVMLSLIKVFQSPDFTEKTPIVQSYSWDIFYNTILLKICKLLNSVGMSLYRKGDYQKAYDYFFFRST